MFDASSRRGYRMIQSASFRNFRGFEDAVAPDCRRINLVVGENASGKTAFLEGIFLATGAGAETALRLRQWRGYEGALSGTVGAIYSAVWGDFFFNYDMRRRASVVLEGDVGESRSVTLSGVESELKLDFSSTDSPPIEAWSSPVKFDWNGPYGRSHSAIPTMVNGQLLMGATSASAVEAVMFTPAATFAAGEAAAKFSELSKAGLADHVSEVFRQNFPRVQDVSIQILAGAPMLFATLVDGGRKVPINSLSSGVNKLLSILIAICSYRRGVVLIDEIENGFYFTRLPTVWRMIADLAQQFECQVFATTHSRECIQALVETENIEIEDVSLIRADHDQGSSNITQFSGEILRDAVNFGQEVR